MKKKISAILLFALLVSGLASCGNEDTSKNGSEDASSQTTQSVASEENSSEASEESEESEVSEEKSEEKSEEIQENKFMPYAEDKSGYLTDKQTTDINFNSKLIKAKDFTGTFKDSKIDENGRLTMEVKDDLYFASFESDPVNVGKFSTMLISWNAVCGNGKISVLVSYEAKDGTWSDYFTYGTWSDKKNTSTSKSTSNEWGRMNVDTFTPAKETTGNVKFKITMNRSGEYVPVVENITIATPEMNSSKPESFPKAAWVKVPMRSQLAPENGADGGVMCSATTVAMALDYLGCDRTTYETAMGTYDKEYGGYGNWLFSVAEAGAQGYLAYCDFYTEDMMKYALSKGYSIGCSTKLTSAGHIVLVVGYETVGGVDYYIVNDPNVNASKVKVTKYTCEYFNSVWLKDSYNGTGVVYVFQGQY